MNKETRVREILFRLYCYHCEFPFIKANCDYRRRTGRCVSDINFTQSKLQDLHKPSQKAVEKIIYKFMAGSTGIRTTLSNEIPKLAEAICEGDIWKSEKK